MPHATSSEDVHEGMIIPKGTIVFPNLPALSRDPEVFPDLPDDFMPERFLVGKKGGHTTADTTLDANASASHPDFRKRDHFHYGFGRRLCQGIFVAEASLYIVISRVLWAFDISPDESAPPLDLGDKIGKYLTLKLQCLKNMFRHAQ